MSVRTQNRIDSRIYKWLKADEDCSHKEDAIDIWLLPPDVDTKHHCSVLTQLGINFSATWRNNDQITNEDWVARSAHIQEYGFPIVTGETLSELFSLLKDQATIDLGCGNGYLTHCLHTLGCTIVGVDNFSQSYGRYSNYKPFKGSKWHEASPLQFKDVSYTDSGFLKTLKDYDVVIMSWPDFNKEYTEVPLRYMEKGQILITQTEGDGGCCATDGYFSILKNKFKELVNISRCLNKRHVQWDSINDVWNVYIKN